MKRIIYIACFISAFLSNGCKDNDSVLPEVKPDTTGIITDQDGNKYTWARYNGLDWMTSNFKEGTPYYDLTDEWGDYLIGIDDRESAIASYPTFGNLYTYADAIARTPAGWRLPTDEDWQKLEEVFGISSQDASSKGWRGAGVGELMQKPLEEGGFNLLLGGFCSQAAGHLNYLYLRQQREAGYYWTSTTDESYTQSQTVYYRSIRAHISEIERQTITTQEVDHTDNVTNRYLSVRYVRDAI